nr:MAG TPA: PemK-like protein [Caudoviricetes sp.]
MENKSKYERYKRGQIIMANFSPSMGSELRNNHLAIVLNKHDSPYNGVLNVIPLSSKNKSYYLPIGSFLIDKVFPFLDESRNAIQEDAAEFFSSAEYNSDKFQEILNNLMKFNDVLKTYASMNKESFAMICNITTISKLRILKPINQYDPIKLVRIDDDILSKIDSEIIKQYTK